MDTDDLSREAYRATLIEAERFSHDLTLQFGLLSGDCKDEQEFIDKSAELIHTLRIADLEDLEAVFWGDAADLADLYKTLDRISDNIAKVKQIPVSERHFDF
ncbi:MAG: hypothetical protein ABFD66_04350 [Smithella sp.]